MSSLAPLTVALPLVAAALLVVAGKRVGRRASDAFAIATCLAVAAMALVLLRASAASPIRHDLGGFAPRGELVLGIALEVEPIGAGLVALGAALAALALLFATKYFERVEALFHALLLAFVAGLAGFALTFDLFDLFVFFELMSVSAFALAGYESDEPAALQGAINFAVPHAVAGAVMLMGIGVLYQRAGTLDLGALGRALATRPDRVVAVAFVLVNAALLVKSALVPFHFWLPDAHAVAPTPVSVMFSSVMVPAGLYGIARVSETAFAGAFAASPDRLRALLVVPGAITVVATGVLALAQRHIKRLLAFSTASHMGLIAVGIALAWPEPPRAAATYALGHGLVKASLFLATGIVLHRYRSVDTVELRGRGREMPWLGVLFAAGALALAGLPPFGVATGTEALEDLARGRGARWFPWLAAASAVLTGAAVLGAAGRVFLGVGARLERAPGGGSTKAKPETSPGPVPSTMVAAAVLPLVLAAVAPFYTLEAPAQPSAMLRAALVALAAPALAAAILFRDRAPQKLVEPVAGAAARAVAPLRALQSGHPGDYTAWLVVGLALLAWCALALLVP